MWRRGAAVARSARRLTDSKKKENIWNVVGKMKKIKLKAN